MKLIAIGMALELVLGGKIYAYTCGERERIAWTRISPDNSGPRIARLAHTFDFELYACMFHGVVVYLDCN